MRDSSLTLRMTSKRLSRLRHNIIAAEKRVDATFAVVI
jgi:hypothetical protein